MFLDGILHRRRSFKYTPDAVTNFISAYLYGLSPRSRISPKRLFIYPTALCDDKCVYCSDSLNAERNRETEHLKYQPENDFFSQKAYVNKIIRDVKELAIRDIHVFGGGEPFFYKENMFYFLYSLRKSDVFIRITTNANNLDEGDIERIVRDKLVSQLNISFNTDSAQTAGKMYLDAVRHEHSLRIIEAITRFKGLYASPVPFVDIMLTVLSLNYDRISRVVEHLRGHNIDYCFFQPLRCYTERQKELMFRFVPEQELKAAAAKLAEFKIASNIDEVRGWGRIGETVEASPVPVASKTLISKRGFHLSCYMPLSTLSICYNGYMPLCQFRYDRNFSGNYFYTESLSRFIRGKEYTDFVRSFIAGELPEVCKGCLFCVNQEMEIFRKRFSHFDSLRRRR